MNTAILIFVLGAVFGLIIQYASLNKFNVISGQALLTNNTVLKTIAVAIGLGAILLSLEISLGVASYHIKPFILGGIILGGIIFGAGMAILGYCPGTLAISIGEGSLDALVGIMGGLTGGLAFTLLLPSIHNLLGPDLGKLSLFSITGGLSFIYYFLLLLLGAGFILMAFWINKKDKKADNKWLIAGIALAILNGIVFLKSVTNRPIGASTSYPYLVDFLTGATKNSYFQKIETPGNWELIFLFGAFIAVLVNSIIKKQFKFKLIYSNWEERFGNSKLKRIIWAFIGGFILIFGARMAGGCTSGHIISGGMQLSVSSLVFAFFVFASLIITGKLFYRKQDM
ncbi:MAG: YeeE/YedE family protein [Chlorobi bacterium]|nr:YeeE/YedE family protein [Chlorobiota bacterium]